MTAPASIAVVAVVGSANLDLVAHTERAPEAGETVLGTRFEVIEGGKGANQAIAAAAHAPTAFVGCVGDDDAGRRLREHLTASGVRVDHVATGAQPSGHALITVAGDGENRIVVVPGANRELTVAHVVDVLTALRPAAVLCQLEIPLDAVTAAARWARAHGAVFLLNPSPMRDLPLELLDLVDVLLVNTGEARAMLAQREAAGTSTPNGNETPVALVSALRSHGQTVVVTAGADGVAYATPGTAPTHVPAKPVRVVDTTGAGDTFAGALAALLAQGADLAAAVREANAAAARVVAMPRERR